jgi:hypothetical protein
VASAAIPVDWRRGIVERAELPRFLFAPDDIVVVVGQDGLVANTAKYLDGQPVLGVNPEPARNPGVLVPTPPAHVGELLRNVALGRGDVRFERRTMVSAELDDGQQLVALNEIYVGNASHQTARYEITPPGGPGERQASSGVLVSTGTGATGWAASVARERRSPLRLPGPEDDDLAWFVREAWPSPATGVTATQGLLRDGAVLRLVVESDALVAFGDGIEADALALTYGQTVRLSRATRILSLAIGAT